MSWRKDGLIVSRGPEERGLEPEWRYNARRDADNHKVSLFKCEANRRAFIAGGAALALEYAAQRRAVASPLFHPGSGSSSPGGIYILANPGTTYQYLPAALAAMTDGDTVMIPAGLTYTYLGTTYNYANWQNSSSIGYGNTAGDGFNSMFLGKNSLGFSGFIPGADYGTIQAYGSANNGRALLSPAFAILLHPYNPGDNEIYFDPSTPVSNLVGITSSFLYIAPTTANNAGGWTYMTIQCTGVDTVNNGLTGVSGNTGSTAIPAGTVLAQYLGGTSVSTGLFTTVGANPGWTFTNIEMAYATQNGTTVTVVRMGTPNPGDQIGSVTFNNCYLHNCYMGPGQGYVSNGSTNTVSAQFYDTEIYQCGVAFREAHNMYIGAISELLVDNCYSHDTCGTWLVKSRAALNLLTYNQIRGERTDSNPSGQDNSGIDISNGGLTYVIGNMGQQSLNAANQLVNYNAESAPHGNGSLMAGAPPPIQELYVVNCDLIGPTNGTGGSTGVGYAPVKLGNNFVQNPEMPKLSQSTHGSWPARTYWVANTLTGATSGESMSSQLVGTVGAASSNVYNLLSVSASNVITAQSPVSRTGAADWNCYANYADPPIYLNGDPVNTGVAQTGNFFFWDSGFTQPIFSTTSGGTTISCTGTLNSTFPNIIVGATGLTGLANFNQLLGLMVYIGGTATGLFVNAVNATTGNLTLSGNYSGSASSFTFGHYLYCGFTYQTALGDSVNAALLSYWGISLDNPVFGPYVQAAYFTSVRYDGSYATSATRMVTGATIQVPPGDVLVVTPPAAGPSWASGINFWATNVSWNPNLSFLVNLAVDGCNIGLSKQNTSVIGFGGSPFTTPAGVITKAQGHVAPAFDSCNLFLQNSSPIAIGTPFTEPTTGVGPTGLVNNNATKNKLQWFRRYAVDYNGQDMDCWYAVVPSGGLSSYTDTIWLTGYFNQTPMGVANTSYNGSISIWRGVTGFDANFPFPVGEDLTNSATVTTAAGNVVLLSAFYGSGTAPSGFTQITTGSYMNSSYRSFTSAQTGLSIAETGGSSSDINAVDALIGSVSPPTHISNVILSGTGNQINFTVSSANAGDILYLHLGMNNNGQVIGIGQMTSPPPTPADAVGISPSCLGQNNIYVNYYNVPTSGSMFCNGDNGDVAMPSGGYVTEKTNLDCNAYNGTTFVAPTFATVFNDPTQSNYNYALASGSPALGTATGPPPPVHGQNLVPDAQSSWSGLPTPGTPIPAKATRNDISTTPGVMAGAKGALS